VTRIGKRSESGFKTFDRVSGQGEKFNRRNTLSILRVERLVPTEIGPKGSFEIVSIIIAAGWGQGDR
jgi:hypothetical protein